MFLFEWFPRWSVQSTKRVLDTRDALLVINGHAQTDQKKAEEVFRKARHIRGTGGFDILWMKG